MGFEFNKPFLPPLPLDHAALLDCLFALEAHYKLPRVSYLGRSILGKEIPLLSMGHGSRTVLYVGAHHGMEWMSSAWLLRFIAELCRYYESGGRVGKTSVRTLLDTHTLVFVPMLNPDGVGYQIHGVDPDNPLSERLTGMLGEEPDFTHWQANARGVDLNHNYNADFSHYKALEAQNGITGGCPSRYSGEAPESEPEVHALCNWIRFQQNLRGVMTLHTQGEEIYYKSGGVCPHGAEAVARRLSALCGYRLSEAEGLASYGGLTDWCIRELQIPSFTLECGRGENPLPESSFLPVYTSLRQVLFSFPTLL